MELCDVLGVTGDQVPDTHHELGPHQVEALDRGLEDARPVAALEIRDDGEREGVGVVLELEMRPRIRSGLDWNGDRRGDRTREHQ